VIDVTKGFTSIDVAADGYPHFDQGAYLSANSSGGPVVSRHPTGARVTLTFSRDAPLPPNTDIRVQYDIAQNGDVREILGTPQLTHTRAGGDGATSYHYRLSHWIPALSVMSFVQAFR